MTRIHYRLRQGVRLIRTPEGCFCQTALPLLSIRGNEALLRILDKLKKTGPLAETALSPNEKKVFERLADKGVLRKEEVREPEEWPPVSVIIPVRNRPQDLRECLQSLQGLIYPRDKLEILVIDDGSTEETAQVLGSFRVRTLRMNRSVGPAACRNLAALEAKGKVLAFLDSDCLPSPRWLCELIGFLAEPRVGAVGGYVDGFYHATPLDHYEGACSPLNMGRREKRAGPDSSAFYLPSCNLLVPREVFLEVGGFKQSLHVGEDVDFCWRLRKRGYVIHYTPGGRVRHKHRNRLRPMLMRRFEYGTSEASLLLHHPERIKEIPLSRRDQLLFAATCLFLLFPAWWTLMPWAGTMTWDCLRKGLLVRRKRIPHVPLSWIVLSTLRWGCLSLFGPAYFLIRYHLGLLLLSGLLFPNVWLVAAVLFTVAMVGTRLSKRPALSMLPFALYFVLEQLAYQAGVISGCLRFKNWRPFLFRLNPGAHMLLRKTMTGVLTPKDGF